MEDLVSIHIITIIAREVVWIIRKTIYFRLNACTVLTIISNKYRGEFKLIKRFKYENR